MKNNLNNMDFHLAKCVHLQKGKRTFVQPCAMTGTNAPINIWCTSLTKTKDKHEQKLKAMYGNENLQFSTQHIRRLQKEPEIGRNVIRNKEERNFCNIDIFSPISVENWKRKHKKRNRESILQLVKMGEFFPWNYPNDFHIQFIEQAAQVDGWIFKKICIVIIWNDNHI